MSSSKRAAWVSAAEDHGRRTEGQAPRYGLESGAMRTTVPSGTPSMLLSSSQPEEQDHVRDRPGEGRQGARCRPSRCAHADRARVRQGHGHAHGRRGRIVEVFGPESSGKTTLIYHVLAEAQKLGGVCAFIDAEHAMDPLYAKEIGVDIDELLVSQPDYGEQALEVADMLVRSGAVDVVAIDSVAALTPRVEVEGQMGDQTVGAQARMMSQAMRKLAGNLNRTQTLCILTNQIREKVGVMFGSPETQPGGRALKFYASQRLDIRRIETLKDGTEAVGNRVRVKVVKNKVAAPFRQAEFDIEFGKGVSTAGCLIDLGLEHNIVSKSGAFFSYGNDRLGQGRNNAKAYLDENPAVAKEIEDKIYAALGLGKDLVTPIDRDTTGSSPKGAIEPPI